MEVIKSDGSRQPFDETKIQSHAAWACSDLDVSQSNLEINIGLIFYDGIRTTEIAQGLIMAAAQLIDEKHPDYTYVAARLTLQKIYKEVTGGEISYPHLRAYLEEGILSEQLDPRLVSGKFNLDVLNAAIVPSRDLQFKYLGIQTLADRYLLRTRQTTSGEHQRVFEMPQHLFMRVAMGLALNEPDATRRALEFYEVMSLFEYMPSTPTLFNAGTRWPQLSSCYGTEIPDDLEGIFDIGFKESAMLSKFAGGIGSSFTRLRGSGSPIRSTNGKSTGPIPFIKIYNDVAVAVNQGGKRKGAFAPYLEAWHVDIFDFIDLKMKTGDEHMRAHDVFPAVWTPDLFFKRKAVDGHWTLFCPSDVPHLTDLFGEDFEKAYVEAEEAGLGRRTVKAMDLWQTWLDRLNRTGAPWVTFKDECNRRNPQQHVGRVHNSNLCVAPETAVLTDRGHIPIAELEGQKVNVWNGEQFSEVEVVKTGTNQKLLSVTLSNGAALDCTPYHKFYVQKNYWGGSIEKRAHELQPGDKLIKLATPALAGEGEFPHAYTAGFFCGDGTYGQGKPIIQLYGEKKKLVGELAIKSGSWVEQASGRLSFTLVDDLPQKFTVPHDYSLESRLEWLAGLLDADGAVARNASNESYQIGSVEPAFLNEVRLMLQTLGIQTKVTLMREASNVKFAHDAQAYDTQAIYRLLICSDDTQRLLNLGLKTRRLTVQSRVPNRSASQFVQVVSVQDQGRKDDTYCFSEPLRHMGVFNGVLTGNCTEITLINSLDETFVCNLGSVNLAKMIDEGQLRRTVRTAVRMLDNVIDLNYYPTENSRHSNLRHRPVGLGVMGYAEWLVQQGISFESEEHLGRVDELFEVISFAAIDASADLAKERGAYETFPGSLWSQGKLTIDHARDSHCHVYGKTEWSVLREKVKSTGIRNSNITAIAPTATIANIVGTTETIQPINERVLVKENLSGAFKIINPLAKYRRPELVKTVWEIDQEWLIRAAAVRQKWVDQAQSLNLFKRAEIRGRDLDHWYTLANHLGVKTTYYLKVQKQNADEKQVGQEFAAQSAPAPDFVCEACE